MYYRFDKDDPYSPNRSHQAKICINGSWAAIGVPRVTSLPSNPSDGDEVYLRVYSPAGGYIMWHVRYDASILDSYKWVVLGGSPLHARADTSGSRNGGYTSSLTGGGSGPSVSLPRAGIYDVTVGAGMWSDSTNGYAFMSVSSSGLAVDDAYAVMQLGPSLNAHRRHTFTSRVDITSAGTLSAQYKSSGGTAYFEGRRMFATPIRLAE